MPLHPRTVSLSMAVTCLFLISFVGWFAGLAPLTCCKRAMIGAFIAYLVTGIAVNIVNHILIGALVKSRMEKEKEAMSGHGN